MAFELNGVEYTYVVGSDINRDGMYLEVAEKRDEISPLFEIFYSDVTHEMSMNTFKPNLPVPLLEWALTIAKQRLPASTTSYESMENSSTPKP